MIRKVIVFVRVARVIQRDLHLSRWYLIAPQVMGTAVMPLSHVHALR